MTAVETEVGDDEIDDTAVGTAAKKECVSERERGKDEQFAHEKRGS